MFERLAITSSQKSYYLSSSIADPDPCTFVPIINTNTDKLLEKKLIKERISSVIGEFLPNERNRTPPNSIYSQNYCSSNNFQAKSRPNPDRSSDEKGFKVKRMQHSSDNRSQKQRDTEKSGKQKISIGDDVYVKMILGVKEEMKSRKPSAERVDYSNLDILSRTITEFYNS